MESTISLRQAASLPEKHPSFSPPGFREWAGFILILLAGAALRLWNIGQNGTGNSYYAAAVRSMMMNWHNFFFVSFDPVGFVTVDKPPVALWIQTAFAKLLGYSGFTLILPQILEGLGAIILVYHLVRRRFGSGAALFSALVMAFSPVSVAVDRYNNTDACLVLVLLLSAWALSLAAETGSRKLLYLALILAGVGFNTKMMAAFVVLPSFYLVYLLGSPISWFKRLWVLATGTLLLLVVALSWPLAVDMTPPEQRPFVGSTQDNSMISLSLGWNGFQRLLARGRGGFPRNPRGGPAGRNWNNPSPNQVGSPGNTTTAAAPASAGVAGAAPASQNPGGRRGGMMNNGTPGLLRLADKNMAGQIAWFLPLALLGFWVELRRNWIRFPLSPDHQALVLWLGWIFVYGVVFSFMKGAMHPYYLVLMVPAIAALAGIGAKTIWDQFQEGRKSYLFLGLVLTAAWQAFIVTRYPDWEFQLLPITLSGMGLALAGLYFLPSLARQKPALGSYLPAAFGLGLFTLFFCPVFWALTPVIGSGQSVEASPDLLIGGNRGGMFRGFGENLNNSKLLAFLKSHHQNEDYLLVSQNSQMVAPIIIKTGEPVVALGGFMGGDPILTANQFAQKVKDGQFRYMLLNTPPENRGQGGVYPGGNGRDLGGNAGGFGGGFGFGRMGGAQAEIAKWVRANGKIVDPALWKPAIPPTVQTPAQGPNGQQGFAGGFGGRRGGLANLQLYDLRADKD